MAGRVVGMLYRLVLWLYPRRVREQHGAEMTAAVHAQWALRRQGGPRGALAFVTWLVVDVARSLLLHYGAAGRVGERLPGRGRKPRQNQAWRGRVHDLARDGRVAVRSLLRSPVFTTTAVVTLALGIGATTAVFSIVDRVLLRPLPYPDSHNLVLISHPVPGIGSTNWPLSRVGYFYFKEHSRSFQDVGAYRGTAVVLSGDREAERVSSARITASVLSTLQVAPVYGRAILPTDDVPGAQPVTLLGHDLWARRYGADESVIGRTIVIDGSAIEVVGVMPRGFHFPSPTTDLWMPLRIAPGGRAINQHIYSGVARLVDDVDAGNAVDELQSLVSRFPEEFPTAYYDQFMEESGFDVAVLSMLEDAVGLVAKALWLALGTVALVLLMACANVANLNLVRVEGRRREVALRTALGANPRQLFWHYMTESLVLAVFAGLTGVALAYAGVGLFVAWAPPGLPRMQEVGLDARALGVAAGLAAFAAVFFGTFPLLRRGQNKLTDDLRDGAASTTPSKHRQRIRSGLVVSQIAMALLLLTSSGLLLRSFVALRSLDLGFDARDAFTVRLSVSRGGYPDNQSVHRFFDTVRERLQDLTLASSVGAVNALEIVGRAHDNATGIADLPGGGETTHIVDQKFAGAGYFEAMGMRLVEGRFMERQDQDTGSPGAIITQATAEQFWPGESALGKRMRPLFTDLPWHRIVGVIADVRTEGVRQEPEPTVYFPFTVLGFNSMTFVVRTTAPPSAVLPAVQRVVQQLDPNVPLAQAVFMEEIVAQDLASTTFTLSLLSMAAAMALLLGAVGIYGMISYAVSARASEIGIRLALGASAGNVGGMVLGQTMRLAAIGITIGLVAALSMNKVLDSILFEVQANDPATFVGVCAVLAAVAAAAGYLPARRAARVDPLESLRAE